MPKLLTGSVSAQLYVAPIYVIWNVLTTVINFSELDYKIAGSHFGQSHAALLVC